MYIALRLKASHTQSASFTSLDRKPRKNKVGNASTGESRSMWSSEMISETFPCMTHFARLLEPDQCARALLLRSWRKGLQNLAKFGVFRGWWREEREPRACDRLDCGGGLAAKMKITGPKDRRKGPRRLINLRRPTERGIRS